MGKLDDTLGKIEDRSSLYWAFYHPADVGEFSTVEVRLNGRTELAAGFSPPKGWSLHRIQWDDTFFIRRHQAMSEARVEEMLCEVLRFADERGMSFHSWQAGPDLAPDAFHP